MVVEKQTSDEQRALADEEMKDWFAAAEQVWCACPVNALSLCLMILARVMIAQSTAAVQRFRMFA